MATKHPQAVKTFYAARNQRTNVCADTTSSYDANGNLTSVSDGGDSTKSRSLIVNPQGVILQKRQNNTTEYYYYANGNPVGALGGQAANFDYNYTPVSDNYPALTPATYTVAQGDTLASISATVYGDARLWYLIADANGIASDANLKVGNRLTIPNQITNLHNSATTHKPYAPGEIIGASAPTLPAPPPPSGDDGCGGMGMIIVMIVVIIVTALTDGALTNTVTTYGDFGEEVATTTYAGGMSAAEESAVSAMAGDAAGQVVGNAIGVRHGFDLGELVTAGITAGVLRNSELNKLPENAEAWQVAANYLEKNAIAQGINILTGQQNKFSWASLAASGLNGYLDKEFGLLNNQFGTTGTPDTSSFPPAAFNDRFLPNLGTELLHSLTRQSMIAAFGEGKFDWKGVATDTFGNAIGNSIVQEMKYSKEQERLRQLNTQRLNAEQNRGDELAQQAGRDFLNAPGNDSAPAQTYAATPQQYAAGEPLPPLTTAPTRVASSSWSAWNLLGISDVNAAQDDAPASRARPYAAADNQFYREFPGMTDVDGNRVPIDPANQAQVARYNEILNSLSNPASDKPLFNFNWSGFASDYVNTWRGAANDWADAVNWVGSKIGFGISEYHVANNADLPVDQGGAIGRTDILSKLNDLHECVALLQAYGAPLTKYWEAGVQLTPGIDLPQNTMIATFHKDANGNLFYASGEDHAALFDKGAGGFEADRLHVIEQYEHGGTPGIVYRTPIYNQPDLTGINNASNYYAIRFRTQPK